MYLDPHTYTSTNRRALLSLLLGMLSLLSFCIGAAPLPMSALFCYPSTVLLGIGALWTGITSLRQMRESAENGETLAKIGIWVGSLTILFVICATTVVIALTPFVIDFFQSLNYGLFRK